MPQFDPSTFAPQFFWLVVSFIALYALMAWLVIPKIGTVLDERQRKIDENLEKAAQLKAEAEAAVAAYENSMTASRAQAHALAREAADRVAAEVERRSRETGDRLAAQIKEAEARIHAARTASLADLRGVVLEVASAAAAHVAGVGVGGQAAMEAAVAKALEEHGQ